MGAVIAVFVLGCVYFAGRVLWLLVKLAAVLVAATFAVAAVVVLAALAAVADGWARAAERNRPWEADGLRPRPDRHGGWR